MIDIKNAYFGIYKKHIWVVISGMCTCGWYEVPWGYGSENKKLNTHFCVNYSNFQGDTCI